MGNKFKHLVDISDEEDAAITAAALADPDNPPLTDEELANMKPFREVFPDLAASIDREIARRGRPPLAETKQPVTIRLDQDVIDKFKATGKGWQGRMNDVLKRAKI